MSTSATVFVYGQEMAISNIHSIDQVHVGIDGCPDTMLKNILLALDDTKRKVDKYNSFRESLHETSHLMSLSNCSNTLANFVLSQCDSLYARQATVSNLATQSKPFTKKYIDDVVYDEDSSWIFFIDLINKEIKICNTCDWENKKPIYCDPLDYLEVIIDECKDDVKSNMNNSIKKIFFGYKIKLVIDELTP
jgi:hypothetical protein